jgi:hypothetical protein
VVDLGDIALEAYVTFTGTVTDEGGKPLAGARVRATTLPPLVLQLGVEHYRPGSAVIVKTPKDSVFELPRWLERYERLLPIPTTHSDQNGRFRLEGVPQGLATILVDCQGFVARTQGPRPTGKGGERDVGTVVLGRGVTLHGRVLDTDGNPLAGARVLGGVLSPIGEFALVQRAAPCNAKGEFSIPATPPTGKVMLAARTDDSTPWHVEGPFDQGTAPDLVLPSSAQLRVLLQDEAGNQVDSAELCLRTTLAQEVEVPLALAGFHPVPRPVKKQAPGDYVIDDLPVGHYILAGKAEGHLIAQERIHLQRGGTAVTLMFKGARTMAFRILDQETQQPVEHALVSALPERPGRPPLSSSRTNLEGLATLASIQKDRELAPIGVQHPGYAPLCLEVRSPDTADPVTLQLNRGGILEGTLHWSGRHPPRRYMIVLTPSYSQSNLIRRILPMPLMALSSAEGRFRLENLPEGKLRYEVMERFLDGNPLKNIDESFRPEDLARGEVEMTVGETTELTLDLHPEAAGAPITLEGRVVMDGTPLPGVEVRIQGKESKQRKRLETDDYGAFSSGPIPPGEITIQVTRPGDTEAGTWQMLYHDRLQLQPGETKYLELDLMTQLVPVLVLDEAGQPLAGVSVNIWGQQSSQHARDTNEEGFAELMVLATGDHHLQASHKDYGRCSMQIHIPEGGLKDPFEIRLDPGIPCAGEVILEGDLQQPSEGQLYLVVWSQRTEGEGVNFSDSYRLADDLRFSLSGIQPGTYQAFLYGPGLHSASITFDLPELGDRHLRLSFKKRDA